MIDQAQLSAASKMCLDRGVRVLQGFRFADTDEAHVSCLLAYMAPPAGAVVADIGCGFGEVARLMQAERPDLDFILINDNEWQLSRCPARFPRVLADMHALPIADASVDVAMFCYALCHADAEAALAEAARVTRPGGELFVFDYARVRGSNELMEARLFARAFPELPLAATGWDLTAMEWPQGSDALFRDLYGDDEEYDAIFADLVPTVWKARLA